MIEAGNEAVDGAGGQLHNEMRNAVAAVQARVTAACLRSGRKPDSVTCIAVSKFQPLSLLRAAIHCGQVDFGENYAQELRDKANELAGVEEVRWHAIGPLQRNKVKYVASHAHAFHALDRVEIAKELGKRNRDLPLRCFIQVQLGGEETKSGVAPGDVQQFLDQMGTIHGIRIVGLMTIPPPAEDPEMSRPYFRKLRQLAAACGLNELSMGTTYDFETAIEEGATAVRVGRAIFGVRHAQLKGTQYENVGAEELMKPQPQTGQ